MKYPIAIEMGGPKKSWGVVVPDLPGCFSAADSGIDEAIEKANNTPYGLSAGVWTQNGAKIFHVTQKLNAGVVWANTFNKFDATSPFGGYKESGFGREGGLHGLKSYVTFD